MLTSETVVWHRSRERSDGQMAAVCAAEVAWSAGEVRGRCGKASSPRHVRRGSRTNGELIVADFIVITDTAHTSHP